MGREIREGKGLIKGNKILVKKIKIWIKINWVVFNLHKRCFVAAFDRHTKIRFENDLTVLLELLIAQQTFLRIWGRLASIPQTFNNSCHKSLE